MREFYGYVEAELPRINRFLDQEADRLDPLVRPVAAHVFQAGGKRLRPLLTILTARALGCAGETVYPLACAQEMLHSATLLHDDILDGASLRRGQAAAHIVFGTARTILAGDVLLALANRIVADYDTPRLTASLADAIMHTATGEIREIGHVRNVGLTMDQYLDVIIGKTANLIRAACQCGAILAGASPDMEQAAVDFGRNMGIAFQMVDDALDYASSAQVLGKPVGGDLREGKITLPLILYMRALPEAERNDLATGIQNGTLTDSEIDDTVRRIQDMGLDKETRARAQSYLDQSAQALACLPDSPERTVLNQSLAFIQTREK